MIDVHQGLGIWGRVGIRKESGCGFEENYGSEAGRGVQLPAGGVIAGSFDELVDPINTGPQVERPVGAAGQISESPTHLARAR